MPQSAYGNGELLIWMEEDTQGHGDDVNQKTAFSVEIGYRNK